MLVLGVRVPGIVADKSSTLGVGKHTRMKNADV